MLDKYNFFGYNKGKKGLTALKAVCPLSANSCYSLDWRGSYFFMSFTSLMIAINISKSIISSIKLIDTTPLKESDKPPLKSLFLSRQIYYHILSDIATLNPNAYLPRQRCVYISVHTQPQCAHFQKLLLS